MISNFPPYKKISDGEHESNNIQTLLSTIKGLEQRLQEVDAKLDILEDEAVKSHLLGIGPVPACNDLIKTNPNAVVKTIKEVAYFFYLLPLFLPIFPKHSTTGLLTVTYLSEIDCSGTADDRKDF